ncbi:MAG: hypothetical protein II704_01120 [Erysipelotrichaceae bacterium]|nr:hypothetical protein [Erysipelotrichaceae bacterium]
MLEMVRGCRLNYSQLLNEGYINLADRILANVNAGKILPLFLDFIDIVKEDNLFLCLEVPQDHGLIESSEDDVLYEVYYLDNQKPARLRELLEKYGNILVHDGFTGFGIGSLDNHQELNKTRFNMVSLLNYGEQAERFIQMFHDSGIEEREGMYLSGDIMNSDNVGTMIRYEENGLTVYDVIDELRKEGLYNPQEAKG